MKVGILFYLIRLQKARGGDRCKYTLNAVFNSSSATVNVTVAIHMKKGRKRKADALTDKEAIKNANYC